MVHYNNSSIRISSNRSLLQLMSHFSTLGSIISDIMPLLVGYISYESIKSSIQRFRTLPGPFSPEIYIMFEMIILNTYRSRWFFLFVSSNTLPFQYSKISSFTVKSVPLFHIFTITSYVIRSSDFLLVIDHSTFMS